ATGWDVVRLLVLKELVRGPNERSNMRRLTKSRNQIRQDEVPNRCSRAVVVLVIEEKRQISLRAGINSQHVVSEIAQVERQRGFPDASPQVTQSVLLELREVNLREVAGSNIILAVNDFCI